MSWTKLPAWTGEKYQGCLNCPATDDVADLNMLVAVGFGTAQVTRDNDLIWYENNDAHLHPLKVFERIASRDPDHDWQVVLYGPLRGRTYQRQGDKRWVLVESNPGFA